MTFMPMSTEERLAILTETPGGAAAYGFLLLTSLVFIPIDWRVSAGCLFVGWIAAQTLIM